MKQVANQVSDITLNIMNQIEKRGMPQADKIIVVISKSNEFLIREYNVPEDKI